MPIGSARRKTPVEVRVESSARAGSTRISLRIAKDEFDAGELGRIVFERDSGGRVSGFRVFTQDARALLSRRKIECNFHPD
jgi:hypothetical protein